MVTRQLYTVKRIPSKRPGVPTTYEILGPGAPVKPIASAAIATMIRDCLEKAAAAIRERTLREPEDRTASTNPSLGPCECGGGRFVDRLMTCSDGNVWIRLEGTNLAQVEGMRGDVVVFELHRVPLGEGDPWCASLPAQPGAETEAL